MQGVNNSLIGNNYVDSLQGGDSVQNILRTTTTLPSTIGQKHIVDKSVTGPSKILSRKWREKDLSLHRQKLAEMKPITHNHPSQQVQINKQKNEQMVEDRFTEIERENRILFEKITQIHLKGGSSGSGT